MKRLQIVPWRTEDVGAFLSGVDRVVRGMESEMRSAFDNMFGNAQQAGEFKQGFVPRIDVEDNDKEVVVRAELPGLKQEEISLSLHEKELTLKGEKKTHTAKQEGRRYYIETRSGEFERVVPLPIEVDENGIEAKLEQGVLTVRLPKAAAHIKEHKNITIQ